MIRSDLIRGSLVQGKRFLACWIALCGLAPIATAAPIKVWSINFNDPAESEHWQFHRLSRDSDPRLGSPTEQVQWALVPRNASRPHHGNVLQFSATSKLSVETYFSIFRPFPPEFQPDPYSDLVLEWEWMIGETELSSGVGLIVLRETRDGTELDECYNVSGHTRYTGGWGILFDPSNRWVHHRVTISSDLCPQDSNRPKHPVGIIVSFGSPVRQVLKLASLRIEEWSRGKLPKDRVFLPHRPPPPDSPFEETPFDQLRRSTAGAAEDLDGDGLPELVVLERRGYAHLYRSAGGDSGLEEITEHAGLAQPTMGTGAMFLDLDADGDRDLVLTSEFDVPRFFENLGDLRLNERYLLNDDQHLSFWYGLAVEDVDRDGDSDLLFISPLYRCFLFLRNQGSWDFRPETLLDPRRLARKGELNFSASFADINDDGWPDFFLGREYLFHNSSGHFVLTTEPWKDTNRAQTEGGVWADFTGDGWLDLLVLRDTTESTKGPTRLFEGKEGENFAEITHRSGFPTLESAEVALAEDFDNDGDLDLHLCQRDRPHYLLLNDGHGHFVDATEGSGFSDTGGCDAAIAADLNGDGGLDIIILRYGSPPAIRFNQLERGRWLGVILEGKPGTEAIGARVRVLDTASGEPIAVRWVRRGQGFGSVGPSELRFGLGSRQLVDVEVRFPSGRTRLLKAVHAGSTRLVSEDGGDFLSVTWRWFQEARFPFVRSFRRWLPRWSSLAGLIPCLAFLACLSVFSRRWRVLALLILTGGALISLLLGSTPGRGLVGSPPALWFLGALAGLLVPAGRTGLRRLAGAVQGRTGDSVLQREDLIRFTNDFRHAGIERRALLSIEGRAQNLFLSGVLHTPFLSTLRELAAGYSKSTGARLQELLALSQVAFPGLAEAVRLKDAEHHLKDLLGGLSRLTDEPEPLGRWRDELLRSLKETSSALEALLVRLDLLCSCDVRDVLREASTAQTEALQRAGVTLHVKPEGTGVFRALITRESLLMILENLFTNSLAALTARNDGHIELDLRDTGQTIALRFSDNGPGIPQARAEKIFQYGFSTRPGGKGYGLARSREILGHFGGGIALEPSDGNGQGAAFLITLRPVSTM